jgi:hypothetical protein
MLLHRIINILCSRIQESLIYTEDELLSVLETANRDIIPILLKHKVITSTSFSSGCLYFRSTDKYPEIPTIIIKTPDRTPVKRLISKKNSPNSRFKSPVLQKSPSTPEIRTIQKQIRQTTEAIQRLDLALSYQKGDIIIHKDLIKWKCVAIEAFEELYSHLIPDSAYSRFALLSRMGIDPKILDMDSD